MRFRKHTFGALFVLILMFLTTPVITLAQKVKNVNSKTEEGIQTVTFETDVGNIHLKLPGDVVRHDVISGTVIVEPKGENEKERKKNRDKLSGCVIEIDEQKTTADKKWDKWTIPAFVAALPIILMNSTGDEIGKVEMPVLNEPPFMVNGFQIPTLGQTGHPIRIPGVFDGDFSSTGVRLDDKEVHPLVESPREVIFESPGDMVGLSKIQLNEGDVKVDGEIRICAVYLEADKLKLNKGETTELHVRVDGLEGMEEDEGVPVILQNLSGGTLSMEGGDRQVFVIRPGDVQPDGTYTLDRDLTGKAPGSFSIEARIYPELMTYAENLGGNTGREYQSELTNEQKEELLTMPESEYVNFMRNDLNIYITSTEPSVTEEMTVWANELLDFLNTAEKPEHQQWIADLYMKNLIIVLRQDRDRLPQPIDSQPSDTFLSLELISPQNNEEINIPNPGFKWSSVGIPEATYTLKIWLLSDFINKRLSESNLFQSKLGIEVPFFMLEKDNLFLEKVGIDSTCLIFTGKSLIPGFGYVWQVDAVSKEGLVYISSPVFYFQAGLGEGPGIFIPPTTQVEVEEIECENAKPKKVVLEWHDIIKDNDLPAKEVLADITNKITIEVSAAPECKIKVDKVHTKNQNPVTFGFPTEPTKTDKNPQTDDDYRQKTLVFISGNCMTIINITTYIDLPSKIYKISEEDKEKVCKFIFDFLIPWVILFSEESTIETYMFNNNPDLEKLKEEIFKKLGEGTDGLEKLSKSIGYILKDFDIKKEGKTFSPWLINMLKNIQKLELGYIVSVYKICAEYKPCEICTLSITSINSSHLGDSDHFIQRKYKFDGKSGTYTKKGDDY